MSTTINPYDLLGLTVDSTVDEAKAAFRDLALIVHPDKGGRPSDFRVLLDAFRYVEAQLGAINVTSTVESLEADFAAFCEAQKDDAGAESLRSVLHRVGPDAAAGQGAGGDGGGEDIFFDAHRFNACFDAALLSGAVRDEYAGLQGGVGNEDGYGDRMVASEYRTATATAAATGQVEYRPVAVARDTPWHAGPRREEDVSAMARSVDPPPLRREVVVYREPQATVSVATTAGRATLLGFDYADAFNATPERLADATADAQLDVQQLFEREAARRRDEWASAPQDTTAHHLRRLRISMRSESASLVR